MEFLNFVMALSPIIVVLVGILRFRQSAKKVAPVALIWTLVLAFTYFNITGASFKENVAVYDALLWKGIKEGLKIVLMVFGAFVILNLLRDTGAINEVKGAIARISDDRRVQVVIVGMMNLLASDIAHCRRGGQVLSRRRRAYRRQRLLHHRHGPGLQHHVCRYAHPGGRGTGHEPHHRFRRAECRRLPG